MVRSKLNITSVCTETRKEMWMGLKYTAFCSTKLWLRRWLVWLRSRRSTTFWIISSWNLITILRTTTIFTWPIPRGTLSLFWNLILVVMMGTSDLGKELKTSCFSEMISLIMMSFSDFFSLEILSWGSNLTELVVSWEENGKNLKEYSLKFFKNSKEQSTAMWSRNLGI